MSKSNLSHELLHLHRLFYLILDEVNFWFADWSSNSWLLRLFVVNFFWFLNQNVDKSFLRVLCLGCLESLLWDRWSRWSLNEDNFVMLLWGGSLNLLLTNFLFILWWWNMNVDVLKIWIKIIVKAVSVIAGNVWSCSRLRW